MQEPKSRAPRFRKTHCCRGHAFTPENTRLRGSVRVCRTCANAVNRRRRQNNQEKYRESQRAACARYRQKLIAQNDPRRTSNFYYRSDRNLIHKVGREKLEQAFARVQETGIVRDAYPIIGNSVIWQALCFQYPKLGKRMVEVRGEARAQLRAAIIKPAAPSIIRATGDWVERINAAVSRGLPRDQRQDIISDMTEAVLAGRLPVASIEARSIEFVRASFRLDHNKFGPLSIDMPACHDSDTPLVEMITKGLWE